VDIDLVISGAIVSAEAEAFGQGGHEFGVPWSGDFHAVKGPESDNYVVESAAAAFLNELCSVGRFGLENVCN
jgi:hypothetical protein